MKKHQTNSSHRTKLALAGVALIAAIVFYVIGNNSPQAAVGNIASVSVSKGVVTFPANTNVSQFQFHVYQVINGTRALITSQPSFGLSAAADPTISAPNRTFSTLATATNPSGAFQVRNGGTYDIEIKHPSLINAATGFGCFARFIVPNSGTSFVLTDGQFLTGSTRLLDRISFPCSGTPTPTSTSTSTASATPVTTGTLPAICSKPKLDVMLVMDNSGSMNNPSNSGPVSSVLMKDMIGAFINDGQGVSKYQAGDRIGGIRFAWDGNNDIDKTHTSDSFAASKAIMQLSGSTITDTTNRTLEILDNGYLNWNGDTSNAAPGIRQASAYLRANKAADATGIIIIFAEGGNNAGTNVPDVGTSAYNELITQATEDKANDILYYGIGLKNTKTALDNIVKAGGGFHSQLDTRSQVNTVATSIFNHINNWYADCVSVTMETSKQLVRPGNAPKNTFDITFTVTNGRRDSLVNGILLADPLPAGLVSSTATSRIRIPLPVMARGEVRTMAETVTVNN